MTLPHKPKARGTPVAAGACTCIRAPRDGEHGLEGYSEGARYRYEECRGGVGPTAHYFRVYPGDLDPEKNATPGYYETCGPAIFARFFRADGAPAGAADADDEGETT